MKQLFATIRAARWLEPTILIALVCILILIALGSGGASTASDEEARMQRILSKIDGAGRVHVMIARDDGGECTPFAVLPSLMYAAEAARGNFELDSIKEKFEQIVGCPFDSFMLLYSTPLTVMLDAP